MEMEERIKYCQACLSIGRKLNPICELQTLLQNISFWEFPSQYGGVCWECRQIMSKFSAFKSRVQTAQQLLNSCIETHNIKSLSTLTIRNNSEQDYKFNFDPLTDSNTTVDNNNKSQNEELSAEITIKIETVDEYPEIYHESDYDEKVNEELINEIEGYEEKPATSLYVGILDAGKKNGRKNLKKTLEQDSEEEVREKFTTVQFTEEEMMSNRERKRNQPNFKKIPYKCDSCVLGFTRKDTYDVHMMKKHDENIGSHMCPVCEVRFTTLKQVDKHKTKHYVCYRCKLCKYETLELWSALSHCRTKHTVDQVESIHCPYCEYVARTPEDMSQHMTTDHSLYCNECGEKFKALSSLKKHVKRIHAVKREFVCDICSKTFRTKSRLESHMVTHNSTIAQKLSYCGSCKVQYKNIYVYRNHLRTSANHAEQTYPCLDCNKQFASKEYWKKHYNFYHLRKSQFRCELCNKLFISDWRLKNHRQTQHGLSRSRDHHCNVCGKQFFTLSTLKGHQLTHSDQRSFMCEDCGDTFKQRPALYTHCKLVHRGLKRRRRVTDKNLY
ncbi:zinc finger protein 33A-like [Pectinophora gossypiella]|nr:zinc finger protein 33A-like [Pectinophora gossypiella]